jgi:hypothetical protein
MINNVRIIEFIKFLNTSGLLPEVSHHQKDT